MKRILKRTVVFIFAIVLCAINVSYTKASEVLGKSASNLDSTFDTKVTTTIDDSISNEKVLDIVFVVDAVTITGNVGSNMFEKAYEMIDSFKSMTDVDANIAIVVFGNGAETVMGLTNDETITSKDYITGKVTDSSTWITNNKNGSNLEAGLIKAKEILDNSTTGAPTTNKNVIVLTDGSHYAFNNGRGESSTTLYKLSATSYLPIGNMDSNGDVGSASRETKSVKFYNETNDFKESFERLMDEGSTIITYADKAYPYGNIDATEIEARLANNEVNVYNSTSEINNIDIYPYTNTELGTYKAAVEMQNIKEAKYNIFTIGYLYEWGYNGDGTFILKLIGIPSTGFVKWTEEVGTLYFENAKSISLDRFEEIFNDIKANLIEFNGTNYLLDEIGTGTYDDSTDYDFNFVNDLNKIDITYDGNKLDKTTISSNTYGFGHDTSLNNDYKFILKYYPTGIEGINTTESIKVDIDDSLLDNKKIVVEYHEKLDFASVKTDAGTYGQYDENGTNNYSNLKTSNSSKLVLSGGSETIYKIPTVSYTIKSAYEVLSNTGTKGTVTLSKEDNISLNEEIELELNPDEGYTLKFLEVTDADGNPIAVTHVSGNKYKLNMPASDIKVNAVYEANVTNPSTGDNIMSYAFDILVYTLLFGMAVIIRKQLKKVSLENHKVEK